MKQIYIKVSGMTCNHCKQKITYGLKQLEGVIDVDVSLEKDMVTLDYEDESLSYDKIVEVITDLGYKTDSTMIFESEKDLKHQKWNQINKIAETFLVILLIYLLVKRFLGFDFLNIIPDINNSISYPLLFIIGLMTSIHCVGMCGSFNLAANAGVKLKNHYQKPLLYNFGRVISYSVMGGLAGLIGKVLAPSNFFQGILVGLAAIFMLLMGLSMLGIISKKLLSFMPKSKGSKGSNKRKSSSPFVIGLLNGLMPCGPLQAMQLYAISTASFFLGAFSMLLFALGTVPLMLLVGIIFNSAKGKKVYVMQRISAALIILLSFTMFTRSLGYLGINLFSGNSEYQIAEIQEDYQYVEIDVERNAYEQIVVQKNIPVKANFKVENGDINGCNNPIMINTFDIKKKLAIGDNIVTFTPTDEGTFVYSCWMSMIRSQIIVVNNLSEFEMKSNKI